MSQWVCSICGYVYDEEKEQIPFEKLSDDWVCPLCGAEKSAFFQEKEENHAAVSEPIHLDAKMKELSVGELAAVCSNLARGCEKQVQLEEAALFKELADFFTAAAEPVPDADLDHLWALIQEDLTSGYPALSQAAKQASDRGTLRICGWGEKVTRILESLLNRYRKEGEAFLVDTQVWVCTVCGFIYVAEQAPELCPVCKVPAWKFEKMEGGR